MSTAAGRMASQIDTYILNDVKHIQDYYAAAIGEFEQIVLIALLRLGNGAYGAAIRRHIEDRTGRKVSVSAVYVTLQRLEEKGMVVSYVGPSTPQRGGRRRRHYLMDTEGARALGRAYRTFKVMSEGVESELDAL